MSHTALAIWSAPYVPSNPNDGGVPIWLAIIVAVLVVLLLLVVAIVVKRALPTDRKDAIRRTTDIRRQGDGNSGSIE